VRANWVLGPKMLAGIFMPGPTPEEVAALTRLQRAAASAEVASQLLGAYYGTDIRGVLPTVRARTMVLHREADPATPRTAGRTWRTSGGNWGCARVPRSRRG